jgi:hypothetical protein
MLNRNLSGVPLRVLVRRERREQLDEDDRVVAGQRLVSPGTEKKRMHRCALTGYDLPVRREGMEAEPLRHDAK